MKCPMMSFYNRLPYDTTEQKDCLKGECGWWDEPMGMCAEKAKNYHLVELCSILDAILSKMPHELQFRRNP